MDGIPAAVKEITIADREADMCDVFADTRPPHGHLLMRGISMRRAIRQASGLDGQVIHERMKEDQRRNLNDHRNPIADALAAGGLTPADVA